MMGHPGIQGEKGDMGDAGPQGLPGPKGEPGESISSPHVIISPSNVTLNESVTARFLCSVTGNPRPHIQWTKEGGSLPSNRTTVTDLGELLIKNVGLEDSGRYKCSARNILGTAEGFGHLSVQGECSLCSRRSSQFIKHTMHQRKVDVDMPNAVKSALADVSSVSPASERTLYGVQHIHINLTCRHADADQN